MWNSLGLCMRSISRHRCPGRHWAHSGMTSQPSWGRSHPEVQEHQEPWKESWRSYAQPSSETVTTSDFCYQQVTRSKVMNQDLNFSGLLGTEMLKCLSINITLIHFYINRQSNWKLFVVLVIWRSFLSKAHSIVKK